MEMDNWSENEMSIIICSMFNRNPQYGSKHPHYFKQITLLESRADDYNSILNPFSLNINCNLIKIISLLPVPFKTSRDKS